MRYALLCHMGARYIHIVWYYESNIMNDKYHHIYSLHLRNNFNKQLNWYDKFGRLFAFNLTIVSILINNFTRNIIFSSKFPNIVLTRQIWGIWKLRPAYSPETPNSGQKRWCFVPCDLEIWWMTLENNRAPLLCCFKLCATFHNHQWIQTGVAVQKRPISVKFDDF